MPFSLFDEVKLAGFHSSIMTTFSVDPAFYDANIQYRLRALGCQNNILLADGSMLTQALEQMPEAFLHAGRKYIIAPVVSAGCFHPKILLRYGKDKAKLVLGSANATSAGWGSNREVLSSISWSATDDQPNNLERLGLIAKAHDWLFSRLSNHLDSDLSFVLMLRIWPLRSLVKKQTKRSQVQCRL